AGLPVLAGPVAEDARLLDFGRQLGLNPTAIGEIARLAVRRRSWSNPRTPTAATRDSNTDRHTPRQHLEVRLFGSLLVHVNGALVIPSGKRDRALELLAFLSLHPEGLPAAEIADVLYPEMEAERAQHNLRMAVYLLRRMLGSKNGVRHATLV